jgi:hypothetical protein
LDLIFASKDEITYTCRRWLPVLSSCFKIIFMCCTRWFILSKAPKTLGNHIFWHFLYVTTDLSRFMDFDYFPLYGTGILKCVILPLQSHWWLFVLCFWEYKLILNYSVLCKLHCSAPKGSVSGNSIDNIKNMLGNIRIHLLNFCCEMLVHAM